MKKYRIIFILFFILNSGDFNIAFSQQPFHNSSDIFSSYSNLVDESVDSNLFFKGWNNLEYSIFLDKLVYIYTVTNDLSDKEDEIYSSDIYQRNKLRKDLSSILIKILGSIQLQEEVSNNKLVLIPEHLLDSNSLIDTAISENRHDGALVKIDGDNIIIYKVLEAKMQDNGYNISQTKGVFKRWKSSGIFIVKRHFERNNVFVNTSRGIIPIEECSFDEFLNEVSFYGISSIEKRTTITGKNLVDISSNIFSSFYVKDTYNQLYNLNTKFIDRILHLLKSYIQIYNEIPSLSTNIHFNLTTNKKNSSYYLSYFRNEQNRRDLALTLYTIYNSDFLYSIFEEEFSKLFTPKERRDFYNIVHKNDDFALLPYITTKNTIDNLIDTLVSLVGNEYKDTITNYVINNRMLILIGKTKNYNETLREKFNELEQFFGTEKTKKIILTNFKHFIIIRTSHLKNNLTELQKFFEEKGSDELFYLFIITNFYKMLTTRAAVLLKNVELISELFFQNAPTRALQFIFKYHLELMTPDIRSNVRSVYTLLQKYKDLFFCKTLNSKDIDALCLNNINTLIYLKVSDFMDIYNMLRHKLQINKYDIKNILLKNFKHLHMVNAKNLYDKVNFIKTYLEKNSYTKAEIYTILENYLHHISHLSVINIGNILDFLTPFLEEKYKYSIYNWLKDPDKNFKDVELDSIKNTIKFLIQKLKDEELVKYIVANINDLKYLNSTYLKPVIDAIFEIVDTMPQNENSVQFLLKEGILNLNDILNILDNKREIYFLSMNERKLYQQQKIHSFIESILTQYNKDSSIDCKNLFTE